MPARNFLFFAPPGDLGFDFDIFIASTGFLGTFIIIVGVCLGAFLAISAVLPAVILSGTKLCLLTGGAVDLRAVGCLNFFGVGLLDWELGLLGGFFLFLRLTGVCTDFLKRRLGFGMIT